MYTFIALVVLFGVFLLYLRTQALPVAYIPQTSQILDVNGKLIDQYYSGQNRKMVKLNEISPYLIQATLAIEDHRFFDHVGFDVKGVARAVAANLQSREKTQGASTITQQLARNLFLTHEKTWSRKMKEAVYSIQLEMQYSKEEILEMYLNQVYYGHAAYGIEAAAQMYFHKSAQELSLAESALLAGVPKGPKYYSPYMDEENALQRQATILSKMVQHGYITDEERQSALQDTLTFQPLASSSQPSEAPYFRDYVKRVAIQEIGIPEKRYEEGGMVIYTTLDLQAQHAAEEIVQRYLGEREDLQGALVAIDPRNGHIRAMVGGKNYEENQFNRVLSQNRQPGSSFKPFVYLTALQQPGFSPATTFKSEPTAFPYDEGRQIYRPRNFADKYPNTAVDLRYALAHSDNIYAVHTIMETGPNQVIETARNLGIHSPLQPLPSLALGTSPVSPLEMASAFGVMANQGVRAEPLAIWRIEDANGQVLYEAQPEPVRVVEAAYTYVLTYLMEGIFDSGGTGSRVAHLLKRPVAAKTGTTDSDAWMVGYTPELSTAVWVGYDQGRNISSVESTLAAPIFAEFTEKVLEAIPPKLFPVPKQVVHVYVDAETGLLATPDCPHTRLEAFVRGTEPSEYCLAHVQEATEQEDAPPPVEEETHSSWWEDVKRWWND
ncbi:transglycosylase domain-containing protein [Marinicrinis sediminis]